MFRARSGLRTSPARVPHYRKGNATPIDSGSSMNSCRPPEFTRSSAARWLKHSFSNLTRKNAPRVTDVRQSIRTRLWNWKSEINDGHKVQMLEDNKMKTVKTILI